MRVSQSAPMSPAFSCWRSSLLLTTHSSDSVELNTAYGWFSVNCTVCASSALVLPGSITPLNSPYAPFFIARMRSIENTTSSAVIGLPSWNFAPGFIATV